MLQKPLVLEVNSQRLSVAEVLFVEDGRFTLDWPRIQHLLSSDAGVKGEEYSSNTDRREARKQTTHAMHQNWRDACVELAKEHPGRGKKWYSIKIARMSVAQGRDAETIRKQLR